MSLYDHPKYIPDELNASSEEEIYCAIKIGVKEVWGELPFESIVVLLAHSALETGRWKAGLHCWNFGNIRAYPDKLKEGEHFTMYKCSEILKGKEVFFEPPHPNSTFRAFLSREEGIQHHLNFLINKSRYNKAWQEVLNGNAAAYSHELRAAGYYTASEKLYTKTLVKLANEYLSKKDKFLSWVAENADTDPAGPPSSDPAAEIPPTPSSPILIPIPNIDINYPDPAGLDDRDTEPSAKTPIPRKTDVGKVGIAVALAIATAIGYLLSLIGL